MLDFSDTIRKLEEIIKEQERKSDTLMHRRDWTYLLNTIGNEFEFFDGGSYRFVYSIPDMNVIFKVDREHFEESCYQEYKQYLELEHPLDKFVLPPLEVLEYKNIYILFFPKVVTLDKLEDSPIRTKRFEKQLDYLKWAFYDSHDRNIGVYNGLPVMIDYTPGIKTWNYNRREALEVLSC